MARSSEVKLWLRLLPPLPGATYSASRAYNLEMMALYCIVVAAARDSCTTLLPSAAADRAVKCPSNYAMNDASGTRVPAAPAVAMGRGLMPWPRMAAAAERNMSAQTPARRH